MEVETCTHQSNFSPWKEGGGCVLVDQIKSVNWQVRKARQKSKAPKKVMEEVLGKLGVLIFDEG